MSPASRVQNELPPRVLMVVKRYGGHGGMQQQARLVSLRMRRRGIPVLLLGGTPHSRRYMPAWTSHLPARFLPSPSLWRFCTELYTYLCRYQRSYDVVHLHGFGPEVWAALLARRVTGKPLLVKPGTAGTGTKLGLYSRFSRLLPGGLPRPWSGVDAWVSLSEQSRTDLLAMGVPASRIAAVPNGVDTDTFYPLPPGERAALRRALGLEGGEVIVATASRLLPHKRVDLLIRSFSAAAAEQPHARLWVMGAGPERKALGELARGLKGGDRIRFWGHLEADQVRRNLQASDVFALLSLYEGLSNALLEAMACGLGPVVSDVSGMADVITHAENGLLIAPDNASAATEALRSLLGSEAHRHPLGTAATETVRTHYGIDNTVDRLLAVYRSLIRRHRA